MERTEIERLLLDDRGLKVLVDAGQRLQGATDVSRRSSKPRSRTRPVDASTSSPTSAQIRANDRTNIQRRSSRADIGKVLPELANVSAREALEQLTRRYESSASELNGHLIIDAINRLTTVGELRQDDANTVNKAIEALINTERRDAPVPVDQDSIYSFLYEHPDFQGRSTFTYLGPDSTYYSARRSVLQDMDLHDSISSLRLDATAGEVRGDIILFQDDRFFGRFTQIRAGGGDTTGVTYIGSHINDRTSSILLVRRSADEIFQPLGDPVSRALISGVISDIEGIRGLRGDPIFTWDMWPTGGDDHPNDPNKRFVELKIPIRVDVDGWFDYDAEIRLWIYFYIAYYFDPPRMRPGGLGGHVAHYGAWVEGGVISGSVLDGIMDAIPAKLGEIDALIDGQLSLVNAAAPFSNVYLLPGDQTSFTGAAFESNVADNVTVVLTKVPDASDLTLAPPASVIGLV